MGLDRGHGSGGRLQQGFEKQGWKVAGSERQLKGLGWFQVLCGQSCIGRGIFNQDGGHGQWRGPCGKQFSLGLVSTPWVWRPFQHSGRCASPHRIFSVTLWRWDS